MSVPSCLPRLTILFFLFAFCSNTNGGLPGALTGNQIMKESYFSAATVVAYTADPNFDGTITYSAPDDGIPDLTKGVEVWAAGQRIPLGSHSTAMASSMEQTTDRI